MPSSSNFFTRLASVNLGGCLLKVSDAFISSKARSCPTCKGGSILPFSPSPSSSSSFDSRYTFRKPSNFTTSPVAVRVLGLVEMPMVAVVRSSSASAI